jgi:hypothetical protein
MSRPRIRDSRVLDLGMTFKVLSLRVFLGPASRCVRGIVVFSMFLRRHVRIAEPQV